MCSIKDSSNPFVTVLMPVRNEGDFIDHSLRAVLAQDYPSDRMEVLIVDGMSDDTTRKVIAQTIATYSDAAQALVFDNPSRIVSTGMNIGLQHAHGDIVVRVDGHCEITPDYVRRCVEALQATGADNVGGLQRAIGKTRIARSIALATSSPFGVGGARFHYSTTSGWADTVYLGAYRREVFDRIGGFDEELVRNQDDELNFRLTQAGGRIWLDPSIQSVYYSRGNLRALWRQYYQYGLYKVRVMQKRRAVPSWRHLVPSAFILSVVFSLLLALVMRRRNMAMLVVGPYFLVNGAASIWSGRRDWSCVPLLPGAFLTMHLAYGIGFLTGLWHWRRHWKE